MGTWERIRRNHPLDFSQYSGIASGRKTEFAKFLFAAGVITAEGR